MGVLIASFLNSFRPLQLIGTVLAITQSMPVFFVAAMPLSGLYYGFQLLYVGLSRQLQRLTSVTFSPIFSHFTESFAGISIIRAFEVEKAFIKESCRRLDRSVQCTYASLAAERSDCPHHYHDHSRSYDH